jgi:hypothetical protein
MPVRSFLGHVRIDIILESLENGLTIRPVLCLLLRLQELVGGKQCKKADAEHNLGGSVGAETRKTLPKCGGVEPRR